MLLKKIKTDTLFKVDGFKMWLSGRTGGQLIFKCANQLVLSGEDTKVLKKVVKFVQKRKENKDYKLNENDEVTKDKLEHLYNTFLDKLENSVYGVRMGTQANTLKEKKDTFLKLDIEISTLLIESTAVSITTSLIAELAKRKIKVIFCDEKRKCWLWSYGNLNIMKKCSWWMC